MKRALVVNGACSPSDVWPSYGPAVPNVRLMAFIVWGKIVRFGHGCEIVFMMGSDYEICRTPCVSKFHPTLIDRVKVTLDPSHDVTFL